MNSQRRHIALLIDTSTSWGERVIRGVYQFAQDQADWQLYVEPRGRYERIAIPRGWNGDGIIARVSRSDLAQELVASGLPTVNTSWYHFSGPNVAHCTVDEVESGQLAAQHFVAAGFKNFAYCGPRQLPSGEDAFGEAFRAAVGVAGYTCNNFESKSFQSAAWDEQSAILTAWLNQLPRPVAVLCWCSARGREVTEACRLTGIRVPEDVAVMGGDYDELMEDISRPPLSTIEQPAERVGFESAKLLSEMMCGAPVPTEPLLFPPSRIDVRQSTDLLATDDPTVRLALQFIRENAMRDIRVRDVVNELALSRRSLEHRFVVTLGRTPAEEIRRVRIEAAKKLLVESNLSMARIAERCGFGQQDLFSRVFRRFVGCTPTDYRRQHGSTR